MTQENSNDQKNRQGPTEARWLSYRKGDTDGAGAKIEAIIHCSAKGAVYLASGDNLNWENQEGLGSHWTRSTADAINLLTPVRTTIRDPTDRSRALKML